MKSCSRLLQSSMDLPSTPVPQMDMFSSEWDTRSCGSMSRNSTPRSSNRSSPGESRSLNISALSTRLLSQSYSGSGCSYNNRAAELSNGTNSNSNDKYPSITVMNRRNSLASFEGERNEDSPPPLPPPRKSKTRASFHKLTLPTTRPCSEFVGINNNTLNSESVGRIESAIVSTTSGTYPSPPLPPPRSHISREICSNLTGPPPPCSPTVEQAANCPSSSSTPRGSNRRSGEEEHIYETLRMADCPLDISQDCSQKTGTSVSFTSGPLPPSSYQENSVDKENTSLSLADDNHDHNASVGLSERTLPPPVSQGRSKFIRGSFLSKSLTPSGTGYHHNSSTPVSSRNINFYRGYKHNQDSSTTHCSTSPDSGFVSGSNSPEETFDSSNITSNTSFKLSDYDMDVSRPSPFSRNMSAYLSFRERRRPIVTSSTWEEEREFLHNSPTSPWGKRVCREPRVSWRLGKDQSIPEIGEFKGHN